MAGAKGSLQNGLVLLPCVWLLSRVDLLLGTNLPSWEGIALRFPRRLTFGAMRALTESKHA